MIARFCRFTTAADPRVRVGWYCDEGRLADLGSVGASTLDAWLEDPDWAARLGKFMPGKPVLEPRLIAPVDRQEVWAAGVTYARSRTARMAESATSATAYDRVYAAPRPELFFKALPEKVVGPGDAIAIRADSKWSVPEPELALVIAPDRRIVGCTLGNDVSARDIEGENLLYLPQAKIYDRSCALGPAVLAGAAESEVRSWIIRLEIHRQGRLVFAGETPLSRMTRSFEDLVSWLFRCQRFPQGAILLTGTGIVPPDDFSLESGDRVRIECPPIGILENPVEIAPLDGPI